MKLGLMGGTFDPFHLGHLQIATEAVKQLGLDRVLFLPDGDPPHKQPLTPPEARLEMARLGCAGDPRFGVSDMELKRRGRTYTVDSLTHLKKAQPYDDLWYLVGSDTFVLLPTWRTIEKVASLCSMGVMMRRGDAFPQMRALQAEYLLNWGLQSRLMMGEGLPYSSTDIRARVARGEDIRHMVPEKVYDYIMEKGLYRRARHAK